MKRFIYNNHKVGSSSLYTFTTHNFTNCSIAGINGPTLGQMQTAYSSYSWTQNTAFFNLGSYQGYQKWTVPKTGTYRFDITGAKGGQSTVYGVDFGGLGVRAQADITLTQGEYIIIAVGQMGTNQSYGGGGGGATFVVRSTGNVPLLIAGAGGGAYVNADNRASYSDASTTVTSKSCSGTQSTFGGGGGGGFYGAGESNTYSPPYGGGGGGFNTGLVGGAGYVTYGGDGGFGGGGGSEWNYYGSGGGGGGYSGGCNRGDGYGGYAGANGQGGGGSYYIGSATNVTMTASYNSGHGYVSVTKL